MHGSSGVNPQALAAAGALVTLASGVSEGLVPEVLASLQASPFFQAEEAVGMLGVLVPVAALLRLGGDDMPSQLSGVAQFMNATNFVGAAASAPAVLSEGAVSDEEHTIPNALDVAGQAWQMALQWLQESRESTEQRMPVLPDSYDGGSSTAAGLHSTLPAADGAVAHTGSGSTVSAVDAGERFGLAVIGESAKREGEGWNLPFVVNIFRRNEGRHIFRLALSKMLLFQGLLKIKSFDAVSQKLYEERARLVFRNLELFSEHRGHRLEARLVGTDGVWREIPATDKDGRTEASLWFSDEEIAEATQQVMATSGAVRVEVRLIDRPTTPPASALLPLVGLSGITVISDIDDTVKVTEVFKGHARVIENTFLQKFRAVDGMALLYREWASQYGASFEFVSKSPPELHEPLRDFLQEEGFPLSAVHLCSLFTPDRSTFKERRISSLLEEFPERRVVLVGDSGEHDPEIYANIARRFPERVVKVIIRQVSEERPVDPAVFKGIDPERWQVFVEPREVTLGLPMAPAQAMTLEIPVFASEFFSSVPEALGSLMRGTPSVGLPG